MKKLTRTLLLICMMLATSLFASAQLNVKGVVTDDSGIPLPGVTVRIVDTTIGTITNVDGEYSIDAEVGNMLEFAFVGMIKQQIEVTSSTIINVTMQAEQVDIDEVVVIGYGQKKKVTVTGAIASIDNKELLKSPSASVTNSLAGKITGIAAVQNTGQPGADEASLFIRGIATLNDASPLTIVDGVERSFSQIDPEEIESIAILKGASATAV